MKHNDSCKPFDGYLKERDNGLTKLVKACGDKPAIDTVAKPQTMKTSTPNNSLAKSST